MRNNQQPARLVRGGIEKIWAESYTFCSRVPEHINEKQKEEPDEDPNEEPVLQVGFQFLKSMINTMLNPISYKDKNGVYIGVNESFARQVMGLPEEEIVGHTLLEICKKFVERFPERSLVSGRCFTDICREWNQEDMDLLKSGESKTHEQEMLLEDGTNGIFVVNRSVFKDEKGEILGLVTVLQDITELRTSEKALEENEERYRIVTEQTGQLVYDNNLENNKLSLAGAIEEVFGYDVEEVKKFDLDDWIEHIHPEDKEHAVEKFVQARKRGGRDRVEYRLRKMDGTFINVEDTGTYLLNENGVVCRILGVVKDITERKLAQEKLEASEEKYRSFTQNFKGIAFQLNKDLAPEFVHGAVEKITGYTEEDFMSGKIFWEDLVHPVDLPSVFKQVMRIKNSSGAYDAEFEYRIKCKDGKIKWVNEFYQKIPGKDGKPDKYQGAVYDITEKKEAEEALAKMKEARIKEIHHRIKNNLQVIFSLLDLQAEKFEDEKVREAFRESQDRIISMALIHEELYQEKNIETLNFAAYIKKLSETLFQTYRLDHPGVSLEIDLQEDVFLDVDTAVPLGIIINELVSNSLKHAFPGQKEGKIRIRLNKAIKDESRPEGGKGEKPGDIGLYPGDTGLHITVSDNGIGISENIDIKNPDTLGLQLVNALVNQLDGELELKKEKGTEFAINIDVGDDL